MGLSPWTRFIRPDREFVRMKALLSLNFVLLLGAGGYYVLVVLPGADPVSEDGDPEVQPGLRGVGADPATNGKDGGLKASPVQGPGERSDEEKRRRLWARMRPASDQMIPDPDGVGPCPPPDVGGHSAPVVRRYLDPLNGFHVWVHDDGAHTFLHWVAGGRDPKTGGQLPPREIVSTAVPTEALPISPDELPSGVTKQDDAKKGDGK